MAMRTGKTKVLVDTWGKWIEAGRSSQMIYVAPGGVYRTFPAALALDFPADYLPRTLVWSSAAAHTKKYQEEVRAFLASEDLRLLVVNVEAIGPVRAVRDLIREFLKQRPDGTFGAVDESVIIKNLKADASKFLVGTVAPLCVARRILTGLISPKSPLDVYNQFRFIDPRILPETFSEFRETYCVIERICQLPQKVIENKFRHALKFAEAPTEALVRWQAKTLWPDYDAEAPLGMTRSLVAAAEETTKRADMVAAIFRAGRYIKSAPIVKGYKNLDGLYARIAPHSYRVTLEECADLPESDWSFCDVEMTDEQRRVYEEVRDEATSELEENAHVTVQSVVVQMMRLHQILCGHVVDEERKHHELPENRTASLVQFLEDYEGKAVIWCSYDLDVRKVVKALAAAYGKNSVAAFWGGNVKVRESEEIWFKTNDECRFMVATPDAGGRGRDWSVADLVCYYSSRDNLDHRSQSEERVKSVDKKRQVSYVDFRVPGTVEDKIIQALRDKIDLAAIVDGAEWRKWLI
jgi:hypothetical protein